MPQTTFVNGTIVTPEFLNAEWPNAVTRLTGTVAGVSNTLKYVPLPDGWTIDNTAILAIKLKMASTSVWLVLPQSSYPNGGSLWHVPVSMDVVGGVHNIVIKSETGSPSGPDLTNALYDIFVTQLS